ncbi:hypothetical protein BC351_06525 [Paenibacillus ferrarius]|uniref:Uncharacterized protein n=1 Tax=Paenibacillus ferrarius TaxID=1469647 RepID=A0A1V4HFI0_9BACL|nr:hypothetical protein BC351_06525 [Paenibacillus ferrarius]
MDDLLQELSGVKGGITKWRLVNWENAQRYVSKCNSRGLTFASFDVVVSSLFLANKIFVICGMVHRVIGE